MRAFKRIGRRGFTLVELMIVVAIIGVLAALAIYGVRRYLASAKTSEAKNTIGAISRGAQAAFERETTAAQLVAEGASSAGASNALCATGAQQKVPAAIASVKGVKYQPKTAENNDFETGDTVTGWKCLKFGMTTAIYYQYWYTKGVSVVPGAPGAATGFAADAVGDIDGDGQLSGFARGGNVNAASNSLVMSTQVFIVNEFE